MTQFYRDILLWIIVFSACLGAGLVICFVLAVALGGAGGKGGNISPRDK